MCHGTISNSFSYSTMGEIVMAIKTVITCDVCGIDKKEVNHWWTVWLANSSFHSRVGVKEFSAPPKDQRQHVCGVEHAITLFNRFLSHGTLEKEATSETRNTDSKIH